MFTQEYGCSVISPMGLYGASTNSPEFRAQSIKGAMRFWWRAGFQASDLQTMHREEANRFGMERSATGGRSPFSLSILSDTNGVSRKDHSFLPRTGTGNMSLKSFAVGSQFRVRIRSLLQQNLEKAQTVFELTALLGGLGRRARRGFGSFVISQPPAPEGADEAALRTLILAKLAAVYGNSYVINGNGAIIPKSPPTSFQYPNILSIRIKATSEISEGVLKQIHEVSHAFSKRDHQSILVAETGRHASPVCLSLYALPQKGIDQLFLVAALLNSSSRDQSEYANNQDRFMDEVMASV